MTKYMILNSDDFGISAGVNKGIIEAHQNGILSSTCTMVNMPSAQDGIQKAQASSPKLGIGLHLTLSYGKPVSNPHAVPSLLYEDDQFPQTFEHLMEKLPTYSDTDLECEIQAQFDRFVEIAGCLPTHIDSHHRAAYLHPASFETMCSLCTEHNIPMRRPLWLDDTSLYDSAPTNTDGTLVEELRAIYEKYGSPRCPDALKDTFQWEQGSRLELFQSVISSVEVGYTEVICHVGYAQGLQEAYNLPREDELKAVTHTDLQKILSENNIELITFADLP